MENPIKTLSVGKVLAWTFVGIVVLGVLDALNATDWFLYPYTSLKSKFGKQA